LLDKKIDAGLLRIYIERLHALRELASLLQQLAASAAPLSAVCALTAAQATTTRKRRGDDAPRCADAAVVERR